VHVASRKKTGFCTDQKDLRTYCKNGNPKLEDKNAVHCSDGSFGDVVIRVRDFQHSWWIPSCIGSVRHHYDRNRNFTRATSSPERENPSFSLKIAFIKGGKSMNKNMLFRILGILGLAVAVFLGCATTKTTTKNTGVAIKEGATEVGQQVAYQAESVGQSAEDASITSAIKMKYANDKLVDGSNISVDTDNGVVTLKGKVANKAELDRAITLGRSVDGVKSVHSFLTMPQGAK
jgi:hyperosmotically inducible periplasmic protein